MKKLVQFFVLIILFGGCAQVVPPAGGDKDIVPPKIVRSNPTNFTTNQNPQVIELEFDEYVIQRSLVNELLISPPLKEFPEHYFKGKKFFLTFNDTLKPNTTYQFNFGKGLVDLNENNPLDSNIIVFSTGEYLDSLSISGKVFDAFELGMAKDMAVLLYKSLEDSVVAKKRPDYYSRTDKDGSFKIDFIAHGEYQLFALEDKNGNFLYDLPNEKVAFLASTIILQQDTTLNLRLFEEENKTQFIKEIKLENPYKLKMVLNQPASKVQLMPIGKTFKQDWYFSNTKLPNDSLIFWFPEPEALDTLSFYVDADGEILDTNEFLFELDPKKLPKLELKPINNVGGVPYFEELKITSNIPLIAVDTSKIFLIADSANQAIKINFKERDESFTLAHVWNPETRYELIIEDSAIKAIGGLQTADTFKVGFGVKDSTKFGNIIVDFDSLDWKDDLMLYLLDGQGKEVKRKSPGKAKKQFLFEQLTTGKYKLKVVFDADGNQRWSAGSYGEKRLPEKTFVYEGEIELTPNADLNIIWKIPSKLIHNGQ